MTQEEIYASAEEYANKIAPIINQYDVMQNIAHTTAIKAYIAGYNAAHTFDSIFNDNNKS